MNKITEYENNISKSNEYIKHLEEMIIQYTNLKNDNILDLALWVKKLKDETEKSIIIEDPLINFKSAKKLTAIELDKLDFNNRSFEINVADVKVGDYIRVYTKKEIIIGRVKRMTDKTFFLNSIDFDDLNLCHKFNFMVGTNNDFLNSIHYYYFINVIDNQNISNKEIKVLIKSAGGSSGKIDKIDKNFIKHTIMDFSN